MKLVLLLWLSAAHLGLRFLKLPHQVLQVTYSQAEEHQAYMDRLDHLQRNIQRLSDKFEGIQKSTFEEVDEVLGVLKKRSSRGATTDFVRKEAMKQKVDQKLAEIAEKRVEARKTGVLLEKALLEVQAQKAAVEQSQRAAVYEKVSEDDIAKIMESLRERFRAGEQVDLSVGVTDAK